MSFEVSGFNGNVNKGSVGGASMTACAGEFCAGPTIAAQGGFRGGVGTHKDLRGGTAKAGGFNLGGEMAAKTGDGGAGSIPGKSLGSAGKTGTGAASAKESGYNQGAQFAATKK